ncbi:MAG TPA: pyridoxamine 5'-phosphate oxidase family protein, partial [Gemmatimonadota bacterium]|nr:pyridoxamine 5'-phosphate oxidase family protein [Gemmatimonadota bacterium]
MSERARPRRHAERGTADRAVVDAILDEGLVAHVGFAVDGQPYVIPMGYARDGDRILLHGSVKSRLMGALAAGVPTCVTVTLLDGVVLARSTFHSSMNYRSVVVFGT